MLVNVLKCQWIIVKCYPNNGFWEFTWNQPHLPQPPPRNSAPPTNIKSPQVVRPAGAGPDCI